MLKKAAIFGLAGVMAVAAGCGSNKDAGNANSNEANRIVNNNNWWCSSIW